MSLAINTNLASLNAQRNASSSQASLSTAVQRLSSGLRVNSARDDAAGIAIAERMNAQVRGMNVAIRNTTDAISLSQTAEGALGKVSETLQRMRELAVQSANASNGTADRANLDAEYQQLGQEVVRTLADSTFNGKKILGADAGSQVFQVGAGAADTITATTIRLDNDTSITGATSGSITTVAASTTAITAVDTAIDKVTSERATYGAIQNRFEASVNLLKVMSENNAAARGRIMDADYAAETAALSRAQVLQQAGTEMIAQANQLPNSVLSLLR